MHERHRRPRTLALIGLLAMLVAVLAACHGAPQGPVPTLPTNFAPSPTSAAPPAPTGPQVAYRAATEIGVVDGTTVVATAKGTFAPSHEPLVTEDGRFAFARGADGNLAILDVAARTSRVVPLPEAGRIGTAGDSRITWFEAPDRLVVLDLADPAGRPVVTQQVALPAVPDAGATTLLTARAGTVILARTEAADPSPRGGPDTLYAVRGSGPPTSLGATDANTPVDTAVLSPDGSRLAFALYRSTGDACGTAAIVVSDADGTQQTYEVAASGADTASRVQRMWWQDGQPMSLSLTSWHCDPPGPSSPLVWQLGDGGLVAAEPRTVALQESELVPGQRAVLVPGSGTPPPDAGTLVIDDSGRRFPVEPNVDAFSVVPTSVAPTSVVPTGVVPTGP
ncbi:TolB-like translocation protein [Mycolicibacterium grossiae]|nr:hypothetical protein [Mycolicibacterium grossiae]QEM44273.1 hypothetical protein FZ046_05325 [Mycolicibacterium grossiae]